MSSLASVFGDDCPTNCVTDNADELTNIVVLSALFVIVKLPVAVRTPVVVVLAFVKTSDVAGPNDPANILTTVNVSECFKYSSAACDVRY